MGRRIQSLRRRVSRVPPFFRFWIGVFVGGIAGVTLTVFALSAFLFQILQAISTAVLAIATVILALSTLALYRSTRVLAEIEIKRDRRANLRRRIEFAQKILQAEWNQLLVVLVPMGLPPPEFVDLPQWIRELRQLINYEEMYSDDQIFAILPALDQLIMRLDRVDDGKHGIEPGEDQKIVSGYLDVLHSNLKILIAKWRGQLSFLYE